MVILTVFMAISKTKDDNINQAMQKAKADFGRRLGRVSVRAREAACRRERPAISCGCSRPTGQIDKELAAKQAAEYEADIKKYEGRSKETRAKAERLEAEYDRLNFRDDQFDMSDVFLSIAVAVVGGRGAGRQLLRCSISPGAAGRWGWLSGSRALRAELPARMAGAAAGDLRRA